MKTSLQLIATEPQKWHSFYTHIFLRRKLFFQNKLFFKAQTFFQSTNVFSKHKLFFKTQTFFQNTNFFSKHKLFFKTQTCLTNVFDSTDNSVSKYYISHIVSSFNRLSRLVLHILTSTWSGWLYYLRTLLLFRAFFQRIYLTRRKITNEMIWLWSTFVWEWSTLKYWCS